MFDGEQSCDKMTSTLQGTSGRSQSGGRQTPNRMRRLPTVQAEGRGKKAAGDGAGELAKSPDDLVEASVGEGGCCLR